MEIFDHIIQDNEIIGIGPLMFQRSANHTSVQLFNEHRMFFQVHCKQQSIEISSDYFRPGTGNTNSKEEEKITKWKARYKEVCAQILDMITARKK